MDIEGSRIASILGLILCIVEIWEPRLSVLLEQAIALKISEYNDFQKLYLSRFRELGSVAKNTFKEVAKGPKFYQTPEESKAQALQSIENTKENLKFYLATIVNFGLMRPFKLLLVVLNKLGRGRAVGGLGLVLAFLGSVF